LKNRPVLFFQLCFNFIETRHFLLTGNAKLTIGKVSNVQFADPAPGSYLQLALLFETSDPER
jgi:hypothetical protein